MNLAIYAASSGFCLSVALVRSDWQYALIGVFFAAGAVEAFWRQRRDLRKRLSTAEVVRVLEHVRELDARGYPARPEHLAQVMRWDVQRVREALSVLASVGLVDKHDD